MNRTPQTANRDERLDILAGTRGEASKRAVRLSEMPDLVAATAAGMIEKAFPNGKLVARVNFNGTGVVAIRSAANVDSITDAGVGNYVINLASPEPDANYTVVGLASNGAFIVLGALTTTAFAIATVDATGVAVDPTTVCLAVFR